MHRKEKIMIKKNGTKHTHTQHHRLKGEKKRDGCAHVCVYVADKTDFAG